MAWLAWVFEGMRYYMFSQVGSTKYPIFLQHVHVAAGSPSFFFFVVFVRVCHSGWEYSSPLVLLRDITMVPFEREIFRCASTVVRYLHTAYQSHQIDYQSNKDPPIL